MTEFEMIMAALLIPICYVLVYIAGRMNLLKLLLETAREKVMDRNVDKDEFFGREYVETTGKCPMCWDCPDNCPLDKEHYIKD